MAEYQAEEMLQRQTAHSQRGLIVWGLVIDRHPLASSSSFGAGIDMSDGTLITEQDAIVCHCESHTFDCLLRKPSGDVVRGSSFHINAVYTLPEYRKQGLASYFLKQVTLQLSRLENAVASVLFSDIGPTFYERLGWQVHRSTEASVDVVASRNCAAAEIDNIDLSCSGHNNVSPLFLDQELDALLAHEHSRIESCLQQLDEKQREVFAALPTRECLEWQFCSGVLHAFVRQYAVSPTQCGVTVGGRHRDLGLFLWAHDLRASTLYILYASIPDDAPGVALRLMREALDEAHRFGLRHIKVWDPPAVLAHPYVTRHVSIAFCDRDDALSSLLVFKHARDDPNSNVRPKWLPNERFAWV
jgi:GNAT superfamily N-acetyltransferase